MAGITLPTQGQTMARKKPTYKKWDSAEDPEVAFENAKSGEWDKERFLEWTAHLLAEHGRDL
jgi:hypothetical protein